MPRRRCGSGPDHHNRRECRNEASRGLSAGGPVRTTTPVERGDAKMEVRRTRPRRHSQASNEPRLRRGCVNLAHKKVLGIVNRHRNAKGNHVKNLLAPPGTATTHGGTMRGGGAVGTLRQSLVETVTRGHHMTSNSDARYVPKRI